MEKTFAQLSSIYLKVCLINLYKHVAYISVIYVYEYQENMNDIIFTRALLKYKITYI